MDDAITILLREAIDCDAAQLLASITDSEAAIAAARQAVSDAEQAEIDNRESIAVREKRLAALLDDTGKRRNKFVKDYFENKSFKYGLKDESAVWVTENAQVEILRASIAYGLNLIEGLGRAKRAAMLLLLQEQHKWLTFKGLLEAHRAYQLFIPVLQNDPGAKIDLKASKTAAYSEKILEFEKLIADFRSREVLYGNN